MAKFFVDRPVMAIVSAIVMVLVGLIAGTSLPIAQYPQITLPTVRVSAFYPGASALVVEESLAQPIEEQVNGVEGMTYMSSSSSGDGAYNLDVTFGLDVDPDIAAVQVQNRASQANARLPTEALNAGVITRKQTPDTLMYAALVSPKGTYDELFLTNYASLNLIEALKRVKGVGNVTLFGAEFGMRLWLKPDRMASLGVTPNDVYRAVTEQNVQSPAGQVGKLPAPATQQFQYTVQVQGRLREVAEFEDIIIRANPDGSSIRIRDVARVELGAKDYSFQARLDGRPAAAFSVNLTPDASAIETADLIKARLKELSASFPADLAYEVVFDNTVFVKSSLEEVVHTFVEALVLVLIVVFLFLQSWRATLIPMLAVPVSLIATLGAFALLGFTINTLTLFGMVLAIGIVVDDAIVVVEAAEHHMAHGKLGPREATLKAMDEVTGPVIAIALILAAVFVPVAFLGGIAGVMYQQFAITVAVSTMFSAVVALTLTPALCALLLRPKSEDRSGLLARFFDAFNRVFDRITAGYGERVQRLARRLVPALAVLVVLIGAAFMLMSRVPGAFVPPEDQGYFLGSVQLPEAASMNRTIAATEKVDAVLAAQPGVEKRLMINGYNMLTGAVQSNSALFVAVLEPWEERTTPEKGLRAIMQGVYARAAEVREASTLVFNPPPIPGLGTSGGFSLKVQDRMGSSPLELARVANEFIAAARQRPEIGMLYTTFNPMTPAYQLEIDRETAKKLGVPIGEITSALQTFLGGVPINDFARFGRTYKVTMQAEPEFRSDIQGVGQFHVRNADGQMVPLSTLVQRVATAAPTVTQRYNLFRTADVGGSPAPGYSSGQAMRALEEVAAAVLPAGYGYEWSGISKQEKESAGQAPIIFGLALLFVFLFLAALYESWAVPFAVLFAIPLGVFGAMLGLWATGLTNNIYAQIGLVLLIGLAAKNAILIVEFAKMLREQGQDAVSAAVGAAKLRLRPIIMTSFAFILGVVPLILASGAGAASRISMGITVFSGMLAATLLAIFLVPVLFVTVAKLSGNAGEPPAPSAPPPDPTPETPVAPTSPGAAPGAPLAAEAAP
jgi:hydrophobe/amphiphile efflux-1 (HAE1) family protein